MIKEVSPVQNKRIRRRGNYTLGFGCTHDLYKDVRVTSLEDEDCGTFRVYGSASKLQGLVMKEFLCSMNDGGLEYKTEILRVEKTSGLKMVPSYGKWSRIVDLEFDSQSSSTVGTFLARVLFADNGPGAVSVLGDKARDTKMLFHLSEESEYIGRFACMVTDRIGDGTVYVKHHVTKRFGTRTTKVVGYENTDPSAIMNGESGVIKGMTKIVDPKEMPKGVDILVPVPTLKYRKMEVGTIFTVELYMSKRESDDHLYLAACKQKGIAPAPLLRKLDYQTIFRMWDVFRPDTKSRILDAIRNNIRMFYSVFTDRASLQKYLVENGADLASSDTLNATAKAILLGLPVQAKEIEALLQPVADKVLPVTLPAYRFRALPGEGLGRFEIRLPFELESLYKVGDPFTVHRSPNVGIEMVNVKVAGFSDTFEMNEETLAEVHGGDTDGDELTIYEGELITNNDEVMVRVSLYHSTSVKPEKGRALTTWEASYRAALSSAAIGFLDGEVAGVFALFPGYSQKHAYAANAVLRSVDGAKHAEVVMPTPGELTRIFRKSKIIGGKTRLAPAAIYRLLNRKFEKFLDFNRLITKAHKELGKFRSISDIEDVAVPELRYLDMPDARRFFREEETGVYKLAVSPDERKRLNDHMPSLLIYKNNWEQISVPVAKRREGTTALIADHTLEKLQSKYGSGKVASAIMLTREILDVYTKEYLELVKSYFVDINGVTREKSEYDAKADRHEAHELMKAVREVITTSDDGYLAMCCLWIHLTSEDYIKGLPSLKSLRIMTMMPDSVTDPTTGKCFVVKDRATSLYSYRHWEPKIVIYQTVPVIE